MMKGSSDKTNQNNIIWQSQMCLKNPNNNIMIIDKTAGTCVRNELSKIIIKNNVKINV